jgi:hypothetical protein
MDANDEACELAEAVCSVKMVELCAMHVLHRLAYSPSLFVPIGYTY